LLCLPPLLSDFATLRGGEGLGDGDLDLDSESSLSLLTDALRSGTVEDVMRSGCHKSQEALRPCLVGTDPATGTGSVEGLHGT
jgi:hypothetical protein